MQPNEGLLDRLIRAVAGVIVLYIAYSYLTETLALAGYVIGIILLTTAVTGYCHLYKILGISTKK
jgi:hypothetical protein